MRYYKPIIKLGFPIMLGQIGVIITSFADTIMVGHYTTEALASASFVNNIFLTAMTACGGFTLGLTPLVGALFTQKRERTIGTMVKASAMLTTLFTILVAAVMLVLYFNLHRLGQPVELLPIIRPYYLLFLVGLFPVALFNVFAQWSYAINRTITPTLALVFANALNVLGNYMLIYGNFGMPEMGLTGAGISTIVSRFVVMGIMIWVFFTGKKFVTQRMGFLKEKLRHDVVSRVFRTSWPVSAQMILENGSFSVAAIMAGWLGAISMASYQVILIVGMLGFMMYVSFGSAVSVLVSNKAGIGDKTAQKQVARDGYHICLVLTTLVSIAFIFFGKYLIPLFTEDPKVLAMTLTLIVPLVLYQYGDCTQVTYCSALRGTSNVLPLIWIAGISYILVGVSAMYLFAFVMNMGVYGIILSFSASLVVAGAMYIYYFYRTIRIQA